MKVYSIGRDTSCNIVINDRSDVISRRHAVLTVYPTGKMTITDQSQNGTYVNGIRISSNTPVPVTRKDNVSFAHVARLDWNQVPNPTRPLVIAAIVVAVIAIVITAIVIYNDYKNAEKELAQKERMDSINKANAAQLLLEQRKDSLEKDSLNKIKAAKEKEDSLNKAKADKKDAKAKKGDEKPKTKDDKGKKDNKKEPQDTTKNFL